jgi:hypothetical protein
MGPIVQVFSEKNDSPLQVQSEDSKLEGVDDEDHRTPVARRSPSTVLHILIVTVRKASYYPMAKRKNPRQ